MTWKHMGELEYTQDNLVRLFEGYKTIFVEFSLFISRAANQNT